MIRKLKTSSLTLFSSYVPLILFRFDNVCDYLIPPGMTGKGSGPLDFLNFFVLLIILFVVVLLISFNCFMFLLNLFSWWSSWCSVPSDLNFIVVLLISCSFWSYDLIFVMLLSIFYVLSQWFSLILCYFEEITFESIHSIQHLVAPIFI